MKPKLIAGNWKMNGSLNFGLTLAKEILNGGSTHNCEYLICPPFTVIKSIGDVISGSKITLGGQDCHANMSGAHTGDISANMLSEIGCTYAILGHSERRADHTESDSLIKLKAEAAHTSGLTAIICVGEGSTERESGKALDIVGQQILDSLPLGAVASNTVIAYEPIWAIGTGKTPTLYQITQMHLHIKSVLNDLISPEEAKSIRTLYGGSVNSENSEDILNCEGVQGALIGGASLKSESFLAIGRSCP